MADKTTLAKKAFFKLERMQIGRGGTRSLEKELPDDLLDAAEVLVDDAFDVITTMGSGRDPRADARTLAERAVIRFVAVELSGGDGLTDEQFAILVRSWSRVAAKNERNIT